MNPPQEPRLASSGQELSAVKRALIEIRDLRGKLADLEGASREPIAIVGLGIRVPGGVRDARGFATLLWSGIDAISEIPTDRWRLEDWFDEEQDAPGKMFTRYGGFISDVDRFDAEFFGISPREAASMDPQQRLALELAWEALEDAGQAPVDLDGSHTGVYLGIANGDYGRAVFKHTELIDPYFSPGNAFSVASGRIAYTLGLQGPAISVDTACSSSLVALHLACQGLRLRECDMALAGGVNLILTPELNINFSKAGMMARDGRCKTFDASANGYVRGEGGAMVVLRRLRDAQADGNRILAVVRGSAVNQDGRSNGLTAPNGPAQEAVIRAALRAADIAPSLVGYVEAHGTGTSLGDPIEVNALGAVFKDGRSAASHVAIGSVKTNIGHLEAAAGITGVVKTVLALQRRSIPPHLHFSTPNPYVDWAALPLTVPTSETAWEPIDGRRIAGVSSFGFSGTNAHVVLEEAPVDPPHHETHTGHHANTSRVLAVSARSSEALDVLVARHITALDALAASKDSLADYCFTASAGRSHFEHRLATRASTPQALASALDAWRKGDASGVVQTGISPAQPARVAFLFPGQGPQYVGMARELYERAPVFRDAFDRCADVLDTLLPHPIRTVVFDHSTSASLDDTAFAQPAMFAIEIALAALWRSWGVAPAAVMGHSFGEYAAACVAGAIPMADAARMVVARGRLVQALPRNGAMIVVEASEDDVTAAIAAQTALVAIAAVNGPSNTVISGERTAVQAIADLFASRGARTKTLRVSHAFHSPLIDPVLDAFESEVSTVTFSEPRIPLVSNLSGRLADLSLIGASTYWRNHMRDPVRFADSIRALASLGITHYIEMSPHPVLLSMGADCVTTGQWLPSLREGSNAWATMFDSLQTLYATGVDIDWKGIDAGPHRRLALPTYPFERKRHWISQPSTATGRASGHPLLGTRLRSAVTDVAQFDVALQSSTVPFLQDHVVQGRTILPATALIEMALAASRSVWGAVKAVRDVVIADALVVAEEETRIVQIVVKAADSEEPTFEIFSTTDGAPSGTWQRHCEGRFGPLGHAPVVDTPQIIASRCPDTVTAVEHYQELASHDLVFGASLRGVQSIRRGSGEALADIELPDRTVSGRGDYVVHPALLDACLQALIAATSSQQRDAGDRPYLPLAIEAVEVHRSPGTTVRSHARLTPAVSGAARTLTGEVTVYDDTGVVAKLSGITLREAAAITPSATNQQPFYEVSWEALSRTTSAWIPSPVTLSTHTSPRLPRLLTEYGADAYQESFVELEALSARWIRRALVELGWQAKSGDRFTTKELAELLRVVPRYHRLLERFLDTLAEEGVLTRQDGSWCVTAVPDTSAPSAEDAPTTARARLAWACGPHLAAVLSGQLDPLQLLFPGGSTQLTEELYRDSPEGQAFNRLIRETVETIVAAKPGDTGLRVLEVGGGTGGTTAWVVPALPVAGTSYLFTDVGPLMVNRAHERFAAHAFMDFRTMDLEQEPASQGLRTQRFDLILASNVVHATSDLRQTLRRLRELLAPGGILLMLEVTGHERWIDITFGLTEGWWLFTDTELRHESPLLSRERWLDVLRGAGFDASDIGPADPRSRTTLLCAQRSLAETSTLTPSRWLLLSDSTGLGAAVNDALVAAGHVVTPVYRRGADVPAHGLAVNVDDEEAVQRLVSTEGHDADGVIHLWGLDLRDASPAAAPSIAQRGALGSLLATVRALGSTSNAVRVPKLWIGTRGGQSVGSSEPLEPSQATLWGLGKVIGLEHPELRPTRIDLDPAAETSSQAATFVELLTAVESGEDQIAVRSQATFVPRLTQFSLPPLSGTGTQQPVRLERATSGVLDDMSLVPVVRRAPGPGEIEIRILASGLNFRDVLIALGMYPGDPGPLGGECVGRVVATGTGVERFRVGDRVIATPEATFATYATTDARFAIHLPLGITLAEAATIPFAFMTAHYALSTLGRLRAAETVLIHAGAGGVGIAAIQLAQRAGATIIATAGSEAKRRFLAALGVEHVFDSRTLDFANQVLAVTGGKGVDVILNSLSGAFIDASVAALARDGRFLEIGKRDIWSTERFLSERPGGQYFTIDLAAMRSRDPETLFTLLEDIVTAFDRRELRPLPQQTFRLDVAAQAFRFMAQARHIGKVVLTQTDDDVQSAEIDANATYLITGGLAGLGLLTASHLAERGARHLVLLGRSEPSTRALGVIDRMREHGVAVTVTRADASSRNELERVVSAITSSPYPLRGVVHSAGVLADGTLLQQTWDRFAEPLSPKVDGSWWLHELTRGLPLDFFVLYSSIASVLGSPGQGNHAAANAFMDVLAARRRAEGLPGLSIGWGAWSEVGAAADRRVDQTIAAQGIEAITPARGVEWLDALMGGHTTHGVVMPIDWSTFLARPGFAAPPFFARVRPTKALRRKAERQNTKSAPALLSELRSAGPARREELLLQFVSEHVARVIGVGKPQDIDPRQPLNELGFDSLMAVELRNRLRTGLALSRSLPATLVFDYPTLEALTRYLDQDILPKPATDSAQDSEIGEPSSRTAPGEDRVTAIDELTDEEIERLYAEKMGKP